MEEKRAFGRCPVCLKFMYGYEDTGGFHPDEHVCEAQKHGGYEPGVEDTVKDADKPKRVRKKGK